MAKDEAKTSAGDLVVVELNHTCNLTDALGVAGDLIEVTADRARDLIDRGGCRLIRGKPTPRAVTPDEPDEPVERKKGTAESPKTSTRTAPENAATRS